MSPFPPGHGPHCPCPDCAAADELARERNGTNPPLRPRKPEHARHVRLWGPRSMAPHPIILTESNVIGLNLHYVDRRTVPCYAGTRYCYPCRVRIPQRWKGYIGGMHGLTRTPVVVEITAFGWGNCPDLEKHDGKLFRRVLKCWRGSDAPQAKSWVNMMPETYMGVISYQTRASEVLCRVFDVPAEELAVLSYHSDDPAIDSVDGHAVQ